MILVQAANRTMLVAAIKTATSNHTSASMLLSKMVATATLANLVWTFLALVIEGSAHAASKRASHGRVLFLARCIEADLGAFVHQVARELLAFARRLACTNRCRVI